MNETHDPVAESWVDSANNTNTDFPLQNLPFCVFRERGVKGPGRIGIALGDQIIDVQTVGRLVPFEGKSAEAAEACSADSLNMLMSMDPGFVSSLRRRTFTLFRKGTNHAEQNQSVLKSALVPMDGSELLLPARIGDYTDFYASLFHASNVGSMFRPDNPLLPNYKYVPVAYHGRASSIVASGTAVTRPHGQEKDDRSPDPIFGPTRLLDYELEVGIFVGPGNKAGKRIDIGEVENHLFGLCLVNDWSARDIQKWEYQPLGPFLAKNFATTISPWVVTLEALEPFRVPSFARPPEDPRPLPYLSSKTDTLSGGVDLTLTVSLSSRAMREKQIPPLTVSRGNFSDMYWTIAQMATHHASNGCNLRPGDLIGSGTVSGRSKESRGCLLELTWRGAEPLTLPTGEERTFLEDADEVIMNGFCRKEGFRRIGFGECRGIILPAGGDR